MSIENNSFRESLKVHGQTELTPQQIAGLLHDEAHLVAFDKEHDSMKWQKNGSPTIKDLLDKKKREKLLQSLRDKYPQISDAEVDKILQEILDKKTDSPDKNDSEGR